MSIGRPRAASARSLRRPSGPDAAEISSIRHASASSARIARLVSLSSTTSSRRPARSRGVAGAASGPSWGMSGRSTVNRDPAPGVEVTAIRPPIMSTSARVMARPSPAPSWRRLALPSTWVKRSKIASSFSAAMPTPVSSTVTRITVAPGGASSAEARDTSIETWPRSVNFTALLARFSTICRIRGKSPTAISGRPGSTRVSSSTPLRRAATATIRPGSRAIAPSRKGRGSRRRNPASMREKSRMSLITPSSARPEDRMVSANIRWRVSSLVPASSSAMPSTPLIGVRISWLMVARNSLLARSAARAASTAASSRATVSSSSASGRSTSARRRSSATAAQASHSARPCPASGAKSACAQTDAPSAPCERSGAQALSGALSAGASGARPTSAAAISKAPSRSASRTRGSEAASRRRPCSRSS